MKNIVPGIIKSARRRQKSASLFLFTMALATNSAFASTGGGLPWETPLKTVESSLTGPAALAISTCALFACGATLVFGGEMTEFVKRALYAVVAISFIVGGSSFMSMVFGTSGAEISALHHIVPAVSNLSTIAKVWLT